MGDEPAAFGAMKLVNIKHKKNDKNRHCKLIWKRSITIRTLQNLSPVFGVSGFQTGTSLPSSRIVTELHDVSNSDVISYAALGQPVCHQPLLDGCAVELQVGCDWNSGTRGN
jgi:hypothetical protein